MQLKDQITHILPPCPKTVRGQPTFIQVSPTHLLYFNGCTVILRPLQSNNNKSSLFINHTCNVTAVKFSNGYKQVASIDEKGSLFIHGIGYNEAESKYKLVLNKNHQNIFTVAKSIDWTSDNKRICIVGQGKNKFGRVINVETGTDLGQVSAVTANLSTCSFMPSKNQPYKLAVGGQEYTIKFYDGPPYKFISSKKSHTNFINQIKYSPDGSKFISVSSDRKIVIYNGLSGQIQKQLINAHDGGIMGIVWIDNQFFVTGSSDKKLKKWNINLQLIKQITANQDKDQLALLDSFVVGLTYLQQKQQIYYLLLSGEIKIVDKNLQNISKINYQGHKNKPIKIISLNNNNQALVLDNNGKILKINTNNNEIHRYHKKQLLHNKNLFDFCLNSNNIAYVLSSQGNVTQIDTNNNIDPQKIQSTKVQGSFFITALDIKNNKNKGFICYTRDHIKVYTFSQKTNKYEKVGQTKLVNQPTVIYIDNENKGIIYIGSGKGKLQIYHIQIEGEQKIKIQKISQLQSNMNKVTCIYKYNNIIFTGDSMGSIRVHKLSILLPQQQNTQVKTQVKIQKITDNMGSHTTQITSILVKGQIIYTFALDNKYCIWKLQNYSRITTFNDVHRHGILYAELVGDKIVTCGGDLLIKVHQL